MRVFSLIVLFVVCTSGYVIKVNELPVLQPRLAPSGWVHLQKVVLPLFENVCEVSSDPMIVRLSQEFQQNPNSGEFWDPSLLNTLQNLKTGKGFLPRGEIFSEYNSEHLDELKVIFNVLYNAKNFDTFLKVAAWARQNINCGLYVDALYLAFENRKDTEKLILPPPYELLPNYFIRKDIIIQGSSLLAGQDIVPSEGVRDEGNAYTLHANYTANEYENDDESKLAYFREDIGLNSHYFLKMLKSAPWLNRDIDINSQYGENMYHFMKQWIARYNMERYSNGMSEQDGINWDSVSDSLYDPMLVYSNGNEFIHRAPNVLLSDNEDRMMMENIENNIPIVVSHMRESGYNKTQILNHLMEILMTGERSYDILARRFLGKTLSNNGDPSVLEHYMTSLRDPLFWKLNKKIVDIVDECLKVLPPYSKSELYFPGVEVMSIEAKKVMTSFDYYQFDITDALKIGNGDTTFQVKIGQTRLNHKPFSIKVNISSLVTQKGLVKIYLGPKAMPGEFAKKKNQYMLLDNFEINLKRGSNIITRTSDDMIQYSPDFMTYRTLVKKVQDAEFGLDSLPLNSIERQTEFPARMIIPKGSPEGLQLQLLVFVAPFMKAKVGGMYSASNMEFNTAALSKLYPMDLTFEDNTLLDLPNVLMKDIIVTHKTGAAKPSGGNGAGNGYSPSSRPNYSKPNSNNYYTVNNGQNDELEVIPYSPENHETYNSMGYSVQNDAPAPYMRPKQYGSNTEYSANNSFDYKSKRVDYKSLYKNARTTTEIPETDDVNIITARNLLKDGDGMDDISVVENSYLNAMQNDAPSPYMRPQQSGSSPSYKRPSFDYKSKRVDYKSLYKNVPPTTTEIPEEVDYNKMTVKNLVNERNDANVKFDENNVVVEDTKNVHNVDQEFENIGDYEIIKKNINNDPLRVLPILQLSVPNEKSFFDSIRHLLDEYDDDLKK